MSESPKADGEWVPTREDNAFAGYVVGWHEGHLKGRIRAAYDRRARSMSGDHVLTLLAQEGFFAGTVPVLDVECGPSPHVGYHLREHLGERDVHFLDANPTALDVHKQLYREFQHTAGGGSLREHWLLGDALDEPYLLSHKTVLVHGTLPQLPSVQESPEAVRATLESLLSARPERLALYLDESSEPQGFARVRGALDALGVRYSLHEGVASADFTPREGGYLVLLTP